MHMHPLRLSLFALLFLTFSIAGAGAKDEIPDVVNETAIDPQPSDDDDDELRYPTEMIIMAAAVLGVCILAAAVILRR